MQVKVTPIYDNAKRKVGRLRAVLEFASKIHTDAASFYDSGVSGSVLSGQYVGYKSGNLRRSVRVEVTGPYSSAVVSDEGIADYTKYVRSWSAKKYGRDFYRIAFDLFTPRALHAINTEFKRLKDKVDKGDKYTYKNPFPA